jgi:hypothetical protein
VESVCGTVRLMKVKIWLPYLFASRAIGPEATAGTTVGPVPLWEEPRLTPKWGLRGRSKALNFARPEQSTGTKKARLATRTARVATNCGPNAMPLTKLSLPGVGEPPSDASTEGCHTTLDMLFLGDRVRVCDQPQTCGEVVRVMPMTRRVVVRLDPPYPTRRGTLRSFHPERLVIYS